MTIPSGHTDPVTAVRERHRVLAQLDEKLGTSYAVGERHAVRLAEMIEMIRATCAVNLERPDYPSSHEALRAIQRLAGVHTDAS